MLINSPMQRAPGAPSYLPPQKQVCRAAIYSALEGIMNCSLTPGSFEVQSVGWGAGPRHRWLYTKFSFKCSKLTR
jgi:hypothetical protein